MTAPRRVAPVCTRCPVSRSEGGSWCARNAELAGGLTHGQAVLASPGGQFCRRHLRIGALHLLTLHPLWRVVKVAAVNTTGLRLEQDVKR